MLELLSGITTTSSALNAERVRLEVISQNIANVNTTRGPNGLPYQRQQVVFQSVLDDQMRRAGTIPGFQPQSVKVAGIQQDHRPPRTIYSPNHPDADAQGMLAVPDINIHEEMADLLTASRAYEANLAVVRNARTMAMQTLSIGKR